MSWIATGIIVVGGATSAYGAIQGGKAQDAMSKYNAKILEQQSLAKQHAITAKSQRLGTQQRSIKAKQRMTVAGRGGLMGGTDLLTLADEAQEMQLDQLELMRQKDIAEMQGASAVDMSLFEGSQAKRASRWTAASALTSGGGQAAGLHI